VKVKLKRPNPFLALSFEHWQNCQFWFWPLYIQQEGFFLSHTRLPHFRCAWYWHSQNQNVLKTAERCFNGLRSGPRQVNWSKWAPIL